MKKYLILLAIVFLSYGCLKAQKQPEYKYVDITQFIQEYMDSQNVEETIEVEDDTILPK